MIGMPRTLPVWAVSSIAAITALLGGVMLTYGIARGSLCDGMLIGFLAFAWLYEWITLRSVSPVVRDAVDRLAIFLPMFLMYEADRAITWLFGE